LEIPVSVRQSACTLLRVAVNLGWHPGVDLKQTVDLAVCASLAKTLIEISRWNVTGLPGSTLDELPFLSML
jgi:hypothetical protein